MRTIQTTRLLSALSLALWLAAAGCAPPPAKAPALPAVTGVPPVEGGGGAAEGTGAAPATSADATVPTYAPELPEVAALRAEGDGRNIVSRVLFATDRALMENDAPAYPNRGDGMTYGQCVVTLPRERPVGGSGEPSRLLSLLGVSRENPEAHAQLRHVLPIGRERFDQVLRWGFSPETAPAVLLFVHGYNVSFADACRRVAQLAQDLKFRGVPVLFSWPSKGTLQAYLYDEEELLLSQIHLRDLLVQLVRQAEGRTRDIIAHSLGARGLINALVALPPKQDGLPYFRNIILAAPDANRRFFMQVANGVLARTARLTLYASSTDQALKVAQGIHGYPRLGEAGAAMTLLAGMDVIDATNVDTSLLGHGYYSSNAPILSDLYGLIASGLPPEKRFQLRRKERDGLPYWEFRKVR